MRFIPLSDVCSINMGQSPDSSSYNQNGDGLPFFQGNADFGERYPVTRVWCNAPTKIAHAEDILISVRAPIGAMNYACEDCCIGRGLAALTPNKDRVSTEFIYWLLKGKNAELNSKGTGSTFKAIGRKVLEEVRVPDISLKEQESFAATLEKVYGVIQSRKQQLNVFDTLIKARFVEMFGDPSVNDRSYRQRQLGELVVNIIPGWSANGESRRMQGAEKAVLKVSAVTQGVFKPEEHKALPMGTEIKKYVYPHKGDLLFSRANTRELVGATAIIDQDYPDLILPDKLWRVLFTDEINVYYAKYVLSTETIRREFSAQSTGTSGSMFNVSAEKFSAIMIPVPPIQEQELFAAFVSQVDKSKVAVKEALDKVQLLFDSLMQKYFG